jgi:hypothetical protein
VLGGFQSCELLNQRHYWRLVNLQGFRQLDHGHRSRVSGASGRSSCVIDLQGQRLLDLGHHSRVSGSRLVSLLGRADLEHVWQAQVPQRIDEQPPQVAGNRSVIDALAVQDRGLLLHLQAGALTEPVYEFGVGHQQDQIVPERAVGCVQHRLDDSGGGDRT